MNKKRKKSNLTIFGLKLWKLCFSHFLLFLFFYVITSATSLTVATVSIKIRLAEVDIFSTVMIAILPIPYLFMVFVSDHFTIMM